MTVGALVAETIGLIRARRCDHAWVELNSTEDYCRHCGVIATEQGKVELEKMRRRFLGQPAEREG